MPHNLIKCVWDAWNACRLIQEFVAGQTFASYMSDIMRRSAVERQIIILAEAFNRIDALNPLFRKQFPEVGEFVGTRNRIIHVYDNIDDSVVWNAMTEKVPELIEKLAEFLKANPVK